MFQMGEYYYSFRQPIWIEVTYADSCCVEFMQHRIDKDDVRKNGWSAQSMPIPFAKHYGKADSEAEARIKAFEVYCNNNLASFEKNVAYILEPLVTVNLKPSDIKGISSYIKEYL